MVALPTAAAKKSPPQPQTAAVEVGIGLQGQGPAAAGEIIEVAPAMTDGVAQVGRRQLHHRPRRRGSKAAKGTAPEPGLDQLAEGRMIGPGEHSRGEVGVALKPEPDNRHPGLPAGQEQLGAERDGVLKLQRPVGAPAPEFRQGAAGEHQRRVNAQEVRLQGQGGGQRGPRFGGVPAGKSGHQLQANREPRPAQRRHGQGGRLFIVAAAAGGKHLGRKGLAAQFHHRNPRGSQAPGVAIVQGIGPGGKPDSGHPPGVQKGGHRGQVGLLPVRFQGGEAAAVEGHLAGAGRRQLPVEPGRHLGRGKRLGTATGHLPAAAVAALLRTTGLGEKDRVDFHP